MKNYYHVWLSWLTDYPILYQIVDHYYWFIYSYFGMLVLAQNWIATTIIMTFIVLSSQMLYIRCPKRYWHVSIVYNYKTG